VAYTKFEREREVVSPGELEALIKEARDRQRRRRRRIALAIALVAATGLGVLALGGGGASPPPPAAAASPGAIGAFLARAERALDGRYSVTYEVTVPYRGGSARRAEVIAAQLSRHRTFYRETPAFSGSTSQSGTTAAWALQSYEVLYGSDTDPRGIFSCTQARASAAWSCEGPIEGLGMGGTFALQGAYPLQALVQGLENASAAYTGKMASRPEPAFLLSRRLAGHEVRCLEFGRLRDPLGSACLNTDGVIASYDLPPAVTYTTYNSATLQSYSTSVKAGTFSLPAEPKRF
jgi:hypothetical protein